MEIDFNYPNAIICRLGCVRKSFFGPNFSLVGVIIRFGANMPPKNF